MPTKIEPIHTGEWLLSEETNSREQGVLTVGVTALKSGQVLGRITASGKYVKYDNTLSTGAEKVAGVLLYDVEGVSGDFPCVVISRNAEVWGAMLNQAAGLGVDTTAIAEFDARMIAVR